MLKNLIINKSTIFYILVPHSKHTGGPTLLHQLGFNLQKKYNYQVRMYYYGNKNGDPVHSSYMKYNLSIADYIEDSPQNILISGEITQHLNICLRLFKIQKMLWWLSVDFFYISQKKANIKRNIATRLLNKINESILKKISENLYLKIDKIFQINKLSSVLEKYNFSYHLCQSFYAFDHLIKQRIDNVYMLSDYLDDTFLKKTYGLKRGNVILYNPKKGVQTTELIIKKFPNYIFKKIENLSPEGVINLISTSKIYIDFGEHPGKDRIPREAAHLGVCIITGMKGSAANNFDIEIPSIYKFDDQNINFNKLARLIDSIFMNFNDHQKDFTNYRKKILAEKTIFKSELDKIFQ
jgi:hypothetical protein